MEHINQRDAVRNIQRYLRLLSYGEPSIPRPPLDGIFETATEDSLKAFQKLYGFIPTGRADKETFDALYREYLYALAQNDRTQRLDFFPKTPIGYEITIGERSITVSVLQLLLTELKLLFDVLDDTVQTGVYDEATAENVRKFQLLSSLPVTGRVDLITWNRILRDYSNTESAL